MTGSTAANVEMMKRKRIQPGSRIVACLLGTAVLREIEVGQGNTLRRRREYVELEDGEVFARSK